MMAKKPGICGRTPANTVHSLTLLQSQSQVRLTNCLQGANSDKAILTVSETKQCRHTLRGV